MLEQTIRRLQTGVKSLQIDWETANIARKVASHAKVDQGRLPVIFFNASTRIRGQSQNAAFSLLASWAVRLAGVRVIHFICWEGMSRCVLGTDPDNPEKGMPCKLCLRQSKANKTAADTRIFSYQRDDELAATLQPLSLDELLHFEQPLPNYGGSLPLGKLVLLSLRWRLRLQTLTDDEATRFICREFMLSAWNIARKFSILLENTKPQAAVLFNGMHFPEATADWLCRQRGVRVITHEVSMYPLSGFFTAGQATALPMAIPDEFELSPDQNARLDDLMQKRFQGKFSMAGIRFFPEMKELEGTFLERAAGFKQIVPVFTNVIFDTTQEHSNTLFPDMFTWLDRVLEWIKKHPETLFVVRAHPDETRQGKVSRESVAMWVEKSGANSLKNFIFIAPDEYISSYELIRKSKFIMIYNSTIGLESSIMGVPVLCAGSARFTNFGTVFFPNSLEAYFNELEEFLTASEVKILPEHIRNSRRFFYFHYFIASLRFGDFLEPLAQRGFVKWKKFPLKLLSDPGSASIQALVDGILRNGDFLLKE